MKKRNRLLYFAVSVLLLGACTEANDLVPGLPDAETVPAHLTLSALPMENLGSLDLGKMDGDVATRAGKKKVLNSDASMDVTIGGEETTTRMSDAEEKVIKNACVFQFNSTTGKYIYGQYVASAGLANDISLAVTEGTSDICVIANMGDLLTTTLKSSLTASLTKAQFQALVAQTIATVAFSNELPMWGWETGVSVSTSTAVSVDLKYMVAKVAFKATLATGVTLSNIKVTMKQVASKVTVDASTTIPTATIDYPSVSVTSAELTAGTNLVWYIPENKQNAVAGCTNATLRGGDAMSKTASYIEVSADYGLTGGGTCPVVYQIYLGSGVTTDFTVVRGKKYNVTATIKGFNVTDARVLIGTDLSAAGTKTANCYMVPLKANTWYRFKGTVRGNGRGVTSGVAADAFAPTTDVPGWKINANDLGGTGANDPLAPDNAFVLWQTAATEGGTGKALSSAAWSKSGYIVFCTDGTGKEANAVIAATKGGDIVWSWHIWKTAYTPSNLDPTGAAFEEYKIRNNTVLDNAWITSGAFKQRTEKSMTRNLGAANNTPANKEAGGLLYQWGRKDPFVGSKDFVSTDAETRNTPYPTVCASGYQWKDGSTNAGHAAATTAPGDGKNAVLDAIKNPMSFYTQKVGDTYDWVSGSRSGQNDNLWGNPNFTPAPGPEQLPNRSRGAKSVYDPCPYGWRVAPQDTWTSFTKSNGTNKGGNNYGTGSGAWKTWNVTSNVNPTGTTDDDKLKTVQKSFTDNVGWTFYYDSDGTVDHTVYFPASGYRHTEDGVLTYVSGGGYSWSASSYGTASMWAGNLNTSSAWIYPLYYLRRTYGFPVRCVQE